MESPVGEIAAGHSGQRALTCRSQVLILNRKSLGCAYSALPSCSLRPFGARTPKGERRSPLSASCGRLDSGVEGLFSFRIHDSRLQGGLNRDLKRGTPSPGVAVARSRDPDASRRLPRTPFLGRLSDPLPLKVCDLIRLLPVSRRIETWRAPNGVHLLGYAVKM